MLHPVQVRGDVWEMLGLILVQHLIHEVHIPKVPAGTQAGKWGHINHVFSCVVVKNLGNV